MRRLSSDEIAQQLAEVERALARAGLNAETRRRLTDTRWKLQHHDHVREWRREYMRDYQRRCIERQLAGEDGDDTGDGSEADTLPRPHPVRWPPKVLVGSARCTHCGGVMIPDLDGAACLQCARIVYVDRTATED